MGTTPQAQAQTQEPGVVFEVKVVYRLSEYLESIAEQSAKGRTCFERVVPEADLKVALCIRFGSVLESTVIIYDYEFDDLEDLEEEEEDWEWEDSEEEEELTEEEKELVSEIVKKSITEELVTALRSVLH